MTETALTVNPTNDVAVKSLVEQAKKYLEYAIERTVQNSEDLIKATDDLSLMSNTKKLVEDKRKEYTKPYNDEVSQRNAYFKSISEPIMEADKITRDKVLAYNKEVTRQREEADRIQEEQYELAQDEMQLRGEITGDLTEIEKPDAVQRKISTDLGTVSQSVKWTYVIEDFSKLPDEFKVADTALLNATVRKHHNDKQIPGVRIYKEDTLQVRSKKGNPE